MRWEIRFCLRNIVRWSCVNGKGFHGQLATLSCAVASGLIKSGTDVIDLGISSTPATEIAVTMCGAASGVIITANNNPGEWNGLKFLSPDGMFLDAVSGDESLEKYESFGNLPGSSS